MGNDYTGRNHVEIISVYELLEMIHAAKISLKPVQKNIVLYTLGTKTIEVNVVPIKNEKIACQDILIVLNDITEIKRLETVRKEFVANVSHELKTPVASISGFAETLLDEAGENPENVAEFTRIIYDESQRLSRLISRLLELSKLESDETKLNIEPININQLLRETVEIMRKTSKLRNIDILFDEQENIPIVNSDGDLINQIIMNFLDNAVKYSADESQIEVKLEELRDQVKISVKDYGIGIPEKEIPRIFERFFRVDKDRSRKTGGSGLGLSIVKHLAENLGGQVAVESKEGQGSTFSLSLPK
jgi:two-component system phosphate regulon sensor histidine kinase PhoR